MKKISPHDFNKHVARKSQDGSSAPTKFKNVCYLCEKPFNKKKGRTKGAEVIFTNGEGGAHICLACEKKSPASTKGELTAQQQKVLPNTSHCG